MKVIYEPKGKAREYSPLALNIYRGCDHACNYCYCKRLGQTDMVSPRKDIISNLIADMANPPKEQVLLCFMGDPYCQANDRYKITRQCLEILTAHNVPTAILSKGGNRCLQDLDILREKNAKIGATLTFLDQKKSLLYEPGAAVPQERLDALGVVHHSGIKTWASIEPVIEAAESLRIIEASLEWVDGYKVGKLNHHGNNTDWSKFVIRAVEIIRSAGKPLYVKDDLRPYAPEGFLKPIECDPSTMFLTPRTKEAQVMLPGI